MCDLLAGSFGWIPRKSSTKETFLTAAAKLQASALNPRKVPRQRVAVVVVVVVVVVAVAVAGVVVVVVVVVVQYCLTSLLNRYKH